MEKSFSIPISRRDFMKLMGVGTMGMLVGTEAHSGEAAAGQMGMSGEGLPVLFVWWEAALRGQQLLLRLHAEA